MCKDSNGPTNMLRVAGFPTSSYRTLAAKERQPSDFDKIPKPYLDLQLSSHAVYEWHCWFFSDKLGITKHTTGKTREEAERKMLAFEAEIEKAKNSYIKGLTS